MEDLKRRYREAVAGRVAALEAALAALASEPEEARSSIRRIAHSLRGSGATYGFPEVTAAAARVEDAADEALPADVEPLLAVLRGIAATEPGRRRVLVVDDDPEMQLLLRAVLARVGVQVEVAESAGQAQERVRREGFDLVLLDLLLPDADGRTVLLTIRDSAPNLATPVFVLSAKTGQQERTECLALGANGFIEKPFDPEALAAEIVAQLSREAPAAPGQTGARPILVVEDDELVASIIKHRLGREGFSVQHYGDGESAVAAIMRGDFGLAIIDVKLPGLDGFELLERLRANPATAQVPAIMLTALGSERDVVRGLELGANDYVVKPFSPIELMARIQRLLGA